MRKESENKAKKRAASSSVKSPQERKRLSPELRRTQIMDAAANLIARQGYLPLSIEHLARTAGASKALIYNYFATQYDLFNALLEREINGLAASGVDTASQVKDLDQAAVLCAMLYFEHVVQSGPLLRILLSDLYMAGHVNAQTTRLGRKIFQRLVRLVQSTLELSKRETLAAIALVATIPEESGALGFHKELDADVARKLCHALMLSSLRALRSPGRVTISPDYTA